MDYVGIDVAKDFHVVTIINDNEVKYYKKAFIVTNSVDGYKLLIERLDKVSTVVSNFIIGIEATGIYGENLIEFLKEMGYNVKLLNPFQTKNYRERVTMKRVKNDSIDSHMIALFLKDGKYSSGYITDDEYQGLRTLYRNRDSIMNDMKNLKKRILTNLAVTFPEFEKFTDPFTKVGLALLDKYPTAHHYKHSSVDRIVNVFRHIQGNNFNNEKALKLLELSKVSVYSGKAKDARAIAIRSSIRLLKFYLEEIDTLEQEIYKLLDGYKTSDTLNENEENKVQENTLVKNLTSIPGVAYKTIAAFISECGDLKRFSTPTKLIGYLGLFPTENSSGNSKSVGHLSKRGSSKVKHALYMSATSCLIHNPELKQLYDAKKSQGKSNKEALIAVSRKLALIIYAIVKYNVPYNPNRVFSKS